MSNKDNTINVAGIGAGDEKAHLISVLQKAGQELASQKDCNSIYDSIIKNAISLTGSDMGTLVSFDEKTEDCCLIGITGYAERSSASYTWELQPGGFTESLLDNESPTFVMDIRGDQSFDVPAMGEAAVSVLAIALTGADEIIGFLLVGSFEQKQFSDIETALFSIYANQASLALQKALLIERTEELTTTDALTGLSNSRHFFSTLDVEINRAKRYGGSFSMLLMDLDNLNHINESLGRTKGDLSIKKVAESIVACSRQTDFKARYGGDEFAMILPNTNCQQASVLANRIRRMVNDISVGKDAERVRLSVSVGIAEFPCLGPDCDDLINAVNIALTICKRRGRNLVCCYENVPEGVAGLS